MDHGLQCDQYTRDHDIHFNCSSNDQVLPLANGEISDFRSFVKIIIQLAFLG